ncbi:MAG: hypothetical protein EXS24_02975 [Pedosphaera sp.]|nr:hypothetical protein [Pedosphaera sp.]
MKYNIAKTFAAALALAALTIGCGKTAAGKPYPLQTCIVTDNKLGSMGDPVAFVHAGQEIKICCGGCKDDFEKEPGKFLAKLSPPAKP